MAHSIDTNGLQKDICSLTAWFLSYHAGELLIEEKILLKKMKPTARFEISRLLISVAAQIRVARDTIKGISFKNKSKVCGHTRDLEDREQQHEGVKVYGHPVSLNLFKTCDKILHATLDVEPLVTISSSESFSELELLGTHSNGTEWFARVEIIKFLNLAVEYAQAIENKKTS